MAVCIFLGPFSNFLKCQYIMTFWIISFGALVVMA